MPHIRRLKTGEGHLFRKVRLAALEESPQAFTTTLAEAQARDAESWRQQADASASGADRATFVVLHQDEAIGLAALYRDSSADGESEGELIQVWLAPEWRGSGVAIELVDHVLAWAGNHGFKQVVTGVTRQNRRAVGFYQRCGFEVVDSPATECGDLIQMLKPVAMSSHQLRIARCREVVDGLSVGDAVGEALGYQHYRARELSDLSRFPPGSLRYTDDTEMALGILEVLDLLKGIDEDTLAWKFADRFRQDPDRGYGRMARKILRDISGGEDWRTVSASAFGSGSFGNGAAMRVAPLGAYYACELEKLTAMAAVSARVTHFHAEGVAGAVAVATAVATAVNGRIADTSSATVAENIREAVLAAVEPGATAAGLAAARRFGAEASAAEVARAVGNGAEISAQDTVPFCLWNACRCLDDYREALISTVEVGGDCDTNGAIVGAIVTAYLGAGAIPDDWLRAREPLDLDLRSPTQVSE